MPDTPTQRILIVQMARFGDLVQTKRLIASLLSKPRAQVHLLVDHSLTALARIMYPDCRVIGITAHATGAGTPQEAVRENLPVFEQLRAANYDAVYNLNLSGLSNAVTALFPSEIVRGHRFEGGAAQSDLWAAMAMRWVRFRRQAGLNLVDFWGLFAPTPISPGAVNPIARRGGKGVGVVLAGRESRRSLPLETLAALTGATVQGTHCDRVVLLGAAGEKKLAREFLDLVPNKLRGMTENFVGQTDWQGLCDALTGLDVLLTPDTGTMHLAAHLGVPVQAFFLSSAWCFETGPYGVGHRVWQTDIDCAPCVESEPCPIDVECAKAFAGRDLVRHLAGDNAFEVPPGLTGYVSAFDPLGVTYRPVMGGEPAWERRRNFRAIIGELFGVSMGNGPVDHELARQLLHDADWMLDRGLFPSTDLELFEPDKEQS